MILFLDFDGVLHPHPVYRIPGRGVVLKTADLPEGYDHLDLFCYVHYLMAIVADFPAVEIVLSTSWVSVLGFARTVKRLPSALANRVVSATYHSRHTPDWQHQSRYQQILEHVYYNELGDSWVAVDDDATGWPDDRRQHLVLCDEVDGLADPRTQAALRAALERLA